ncbi:MAG: GC-type dockerin domain-anchored protein, partial [Planctomycetota bacterium]
YQGDDTDCQLQCPADLDCDGSVDVGDFLALLSAWGASFNGPPDLDGDGVVGVGDFLLLLAGWGPCP